MQKAAHYWLITVSCQGFGDHLAVAVGGDRCAAEVPLAFLVHPRGQVAGACFAMLGLTLGSQAEPLFGPFVCFLLWHGSTSVSMRNFWLFVFPGPSGSPAF